MAIVPLKDLRKLADAAKPKEAVDPAAIATIVVGAVYGDDGALTLTLSGGDGGKLTYLVPTEAVAELRRALGIESLTKAASIDGQIQRELAARASSTF